MPDAKAVMEQWLDAVEARDADRITGMMTDDVAMETEVFRMPVRGKRVLHELLVGAMDAYESIRIDRRKIIASGRDAAALVEIHARFGKDLDMLGEHLTTAGKEVSIVGALFVEVNDAGKIEHIMRVRDTLGVVQQLGLAPDRLAEMARKFEERMKEPPRAA